MKIGHLFLSIFEIKKKVLKTKKLSIFSISLNLFGEMGSDRAVYSSVKGKPPENYQKIPEKCNSHKKI
jgi:hypothetical protein